MPPSVARVRVAIDRGGTFTDIYAEIRVSGRAVESVVLKLLSVDPANYPDAPREGIRRVLERAYGCPLPRGEPLDTTGIEWIRMGTTVATNALLERNGEPCALVATEGLADMLSIGNQTRPHIFDLRVRKMGVLYQCAVEARERVEVVQEACLGEQKGGALGLRVTKPLDMDKLRTDLARVRASGVKSLAVALMHSYGFRDHEALVEEVAKELGFSHVSLSSQLTPMVKVVPRGFTATVDAYLTPKIRDYLTSFRAGFSDNLEGVDVQFMQSDGGLCDIDDFCGYLAILSGPAGGVVGYGHTAYGYERMAPESAHGALPRPVIGFDMGGTSTDVSRYAGSLEHVFETETAGVTIQAPQLDITTVAAGGGSRLFYRSGMFYVGPESAGAHPGPVCYRKGGMLAVTDANLMLGRIAPEVFPQIFGPNADEPLDVEATRVAFQNLTTEINANLEAKGELPMTIEAVAEGFIEVANEAMCRPIRQLTEGKGYDARDHSLACFGGAGGQHACAIARSLGIQTVFVHKHSGILSAYGIALADSVVEVQEPLGVSLSLELAGSQALEMALNLSGRARNGLHERGFKESQIRVSQYFHLRYHGTDFGIMVQVPEELVVLSDGSHPPVPNLETLFVNEYSREHGFSIPGRAIIIDDVRVRAMGAFVGSDSDVKTDSVTIPELKFDASGAIRPDYGSASPALRSACYYSEYGGWCDTNIWQTVDLPHGSSVLPGPCLIIDTDAGVTVVVDPGCVARVASDGNLLVDVLSDAPGPSKIIDSSSVEKIEEHVDPVKLSIYSHRFMGIAEQMGKTLQRTAISTNIKERLDFSCALFDETGGLVANAPHVPVHLGAMQDAVRYQIRTLGAAWGEGEVLLSNHPVAGGTHLPDVTIITPVYFDSKVVFYVASRGHQADIGGGTPGSMPPFSRSLADEGLAVVSMKLVRDGLFQEAELVSKLGDAGCRCIEDVVSDLRAQVAANKKGITLVTDLIRAQGLHTTQAYMHHIQAAAAEAVRGMLRKVAHEHQLIADKALSFVDRMDDGTEIKLSLQIDPISGSAVFDFSGSGPQVDGNANAPPAVSSSAIIYALRCLVDVDIPLNQGCLDPIRMILPKLSILAPAPTAAVVGGNVLTSQRITDVIFGAFGAVSASQGCMNNFTFGDAKMGYYETIAGGCGAGPGWHGTSGVQVHMTNTRMTDPEILERRYPAVLRQFSYRPDSGGAGKWHGGQGLVRTIEFTRQLTVSVLSERRVFAPWGLAGGANGAKGKNEFLSKGKTATDIGGKSSFQVERGDIIRISTPGGGGYGCVE